MKKQSFQIIINRIGSSTFWNTLDNIFLQIETTLSQEKWLCTEAATYNFVRSLLPVLLQLYNTFPSAIWNLLLETPLAFQALLDPHGEDLLRHLIQQDSASSTLAKMIKSQSTSGRLKIFDGIKHNRKLCHDIVSLLLFDEDEADFSSIESLAALILEGLCSKDKVVANTFIDIFHDLFGTNISYSRVAAILSMLTPEIRQNDELYSCTNFCSILTALCEEVSDNETIDSDIYRSIASCLAVQIPAYKYSGSEYKSGSFVWYFDGLTSQWKPGKILSKDQSLYPPSFVVDIDGIERETEINRLRIREVSGIRLEQPAASTGITQPSFTYSTEELECLNKVTADILKRFTIEEIIESKNASKLLAASCDLTYASLAMSEKIVINKVFNKIVERAASDLRAAWKHIELSVKEYISTTASTKFESLDTSLVFLQSLQHNKALRKSQKVRYLSSQLNRHYIRNQCVIFLI